MSEEKEPTPQELKDAEKRRYEKVDEQHVRLVVDNEKSRVHFEQVVTRKKLREDYEQMTLRKNQILGQLSQQKKQLKNVDVEDTEELRAFKEMLDKVQKLGQKTNIENQIKGLEEQLEDNERFMKEISGIVPEVLRKSK